MKYKLDFKRFAEPVNTKLQELASTGLYTVQVDRDEIWEVYMGAFPDGTNNIYKERREYDCNCCKSFIRQIGNVISIVNNEIVTIWDIKTVGYYQEVADKMAEYIKTLPIQSKLYKTERKFGAQKTTQVTENGIINWDHFYTELPNSAVNSDAGTLIGNFNSSRQVLERGFNELSTNALESTLDLIDNGLYKGNEFKNGVRDFSNAKKEYELSVNKELFVVKNTDQPYARFRNTMIGTLVQDLSGGVDLEVAVKKYEDKASSGNYKRTKAFITSGMVEQATKKIEELGLEPCLERRHAKLEDISVNNVLFANRDAKKVMKGGITDLLMQEVKNQKVNTSKAQDIKIGDLLKYIDSQKPQDIKLLVENKHVSNFVSILAPVNESKNIFKWDNNFSWSYNGNITDSDIKAKVKSAGGEVDGVLRFSIQWNEEGSDGQNDLDAHCRTPNAHIYYSSRSDRNGGQLDIDITRPVSQTKDGIAVENITWPIKNRMQDGTYRFYVHNFYGRNTKGFRAQIEIEGEIFEYDYPKSVTSDVAVAEVTLRNSVFTINHQLQSGSVAREEWNIKTGEFHDVTTIMLSPNYWDEQEIGNKHFIFTLDKCANPDKARGFYNEFLRNDLNEHRKVFEVLGDKMKCTPPENPDEQLSGLGFSSTIRNEVIIKVDNKLYNVKF